MSNTTYCDNDDCRKEFNVSDNVYTRKHPGAIEEVYIKCPECSDETTAFVTDNHARKEQSAIKALNDKRIKKQGELSIYMDELQDKLIKEKG